MPDNVDFSRQDLRGQKLVGSHRFCNFDGANMTGVEAIDVDFLGSTFRGTLLTNANCKGAFFERAVFDPADAYGLTWTMRCETFKRMETGQLWWYCWLYFATLMEPMKLPVKMDLQQHLIGFIGAERYIKFQRMMQERDY
jgi:hypothetical protein